MSCRPSPLQYLFIVRHQSYITKLPTFTACFLLAHMFRSRWLACHVHWLRCLCIHAGQSGIPVFEILLVRGVMVLSISYMKAVTATQHTFPYALGQRYPCLSSQIAYFLLIMRLCTCVGLPAHLTCLCAQVDLEANTLSEVNSSPACICLLLGTAMSTHVPSRVQPSC